MSNEVQAINMGERNGQYWVNVRNANPKGMIGDAGVIRRFKTEEEASIFTDVVNKNKSEDMFMNQAVLDKKDGTITVPPISWARATFNRLTDEQVAAINETRRLPENVKIVPDMKGGYRLTYDYTGLTMGTRTVPEGFEMKKDIFGFSGVVPKDTEGVFIKNSEA